MSSYAPLGFLVLVGAMVALASKTKHCSRIATTSQPLDKKTLGRFLDNIEARNRIRSVIPKLRGATSQAEKQKYLKLIFTLYGDIDPSPSTLENLEGYQFLKKEHNQTFEKVDEINKAVVDSFEAKFFCEYYVLKPEMFDRE